MSRLRNAALRIALVTAVSGVCSAQAQLAFSTTDPYNDFLPSYTAGPANGDLDVIAAAAFYDGAEQSFSFSAILADTVGLTPGALYVWGIDRGLGSERFLAGSPAIGSGVFFDSVLIARPDGTGAYNDFINGTLTELDAGVVKIAGLAVTVDSLPLALLAPATAGFEADPSHYTWNLWPRLGLGQNNQVSDFAPDGSNLGLQITAVPEPQTYALLLAGLGLIGATRKRGQRRG